MSILRTFEIAACVSIYTICAGICVPGCAGSNDLGSILGAGGADGSSGASSFGGASGGQGWTNTSSIGGSNFPQGGALPSGGASPTGGVFGIGGGNDSGGASATGGASPSGGAATIGGAKATGGTGTMGGASATGGNVAAGGTKATGGTKAVGGSSSTGGAKAVGGSSAVGGGTTAPTWTQLYNGYFASGTSGNCVSCHGAGTSPSYNSASTMCSALKNRGFISNGTATLNLLLRWFNQGGTMPSNSNATPANAVADITAWQNAGAVCP